MIEIINNILNIENRLPNVIANSLASASPSLALATVVEKFLFLFFGGGCN